MQTQIADRTASFEQVYDGEYLWTDRRLPTGRQVHRLDIAWLQAKLRSAKRGSDFDEREQLIAAVEGQGGLGQMLADLLRNFDFQPPQPTQLNGLPVNALIGQWRQRTARPPVARSYRSSRTNQPPEWPEQLPHHVLLLVGREHVSLCLRTPPRGRRSAGHQSGGATTFHDPLLRYEIYEVQLAVAIPQEEFLFQSRQRWTDETALVLEQLTEGQRSLAFKDSHAEEAAGGRTLSPAVDVTVCLEVRSTALRSQSTLPYVSFAAWPVSSDTTISVIKPSGIVTMPGWLKGTRAFSAGSP